MTLAVTHYAITYSFELMSSTLDAMLFWVKIEYVGIVSIPVLLLLFTLVYTERDQWLAPRQIALFFALPIILLLLVWTNRWHALFYSTANVIEVNGFPQLEATPGIAYRINVLYAYILLLNAAILLIRYYATTSTLYRWQIGFLLAGVLIPWMGDIIYVFLLRARNSIDLAPVSFTLSGVIMAIGLFRYRLLDLMPVARSKLVETMQDAWIVLDVQNRFVDLNSAAQAILRQPKSKLIGTNIAAILPPGHSLLACLASGVEHQTEINISMDAAIHCAYDVRLSLLTNRQHQPNGRLLVLHDITERKMAEDALRALNSSLDMSIQARTAEIRTEKEKVDTILRTVKEGIVLTSPELAIEYANAGMLRLINKAESDMLGEPLDAVPIWENVRLWDRIKTSLHKGESWEGEIHLQKQDGRITTCALVATPVQNETGYIMGCIATFRDITHLKKLDEARNQFIANISHELRTPVTNLKLYLDLLDRTSSSEKSLRYMSVLRQQTERLGNLAQGIVSLARLDSSHDISRWQLFSLNTLIPTALSRYESLIKQHQLRVVVVDSDSPQTNVYGDPDWVQQAVAELIKNAVTFSTKAGEIRVELAPITQDKQQWITIAVADDGPGIALAEQEKVFERFYRGTAVSQLTIPGLGLGLSVVWKIMEAHGGRVTVTSQVNQGSTFTLWLPVARSG